MIETAPAANVPVTKERAIFTRRNSWQKLSRGQKTGIVVQGALQLALTGWTLWDVHHRDLERVRGSKWLWTGLALVQPVGPIAYLLFGRRRQGKGAETEAPH